jgi:hypothetical protein
MTTGVNLLTEAHQGQLLIHHYLLMSIGHGRSVRLALFLKLPGYSLHIATDLYFGALMIG